MQAKQVFSTYSGKDDGDFGRFEHCPFCGALNVNFITAEDLRYFILKSRGERALGNYLLETNYSIDDYRFTLWFD